MSTSTAPPFPKERVLTLARLGRTAVQIAHDLGLSLNSVREFLRTQGVGPGRGWHGDPAGHALAGHIGGLAVSQDREYMQSIGTKGGRAVSRDRAHMAEIGRKGGKAVSANRTHMADIGRVGGTSRSRDR